MTIIEDLSWHTTKLYNIVNHHNRTVAYQNYYDNEKQFKPNWHVAFLHSHTYQQCLRVLEANWQGYFAGLKSFKKDPSTFTGMPRPPKFKNTERRKNEVIFTKAAIRFQHGVLKLSLAKAMQQKHHVDSLNLAVSDKLQERVNWHDLQQVKLRWRNASQDWELVAIYNEAVCDPHPGTNIMAIDLGVANLATVTFQEDEDSYIVNGNPLKAVNAHVNREISRLQGIQMCMVGNTRYRDTKAIKRLRAYRENVIRDYLHKASTDIIELALAYDCGTIAIGKLGDIKRGKKHQRSFHQLPLKWFLDMIQYKGKLAGITVETVNEAYTSGCSALDLEPINKKYYNKDRRVHRGLFQSNQGIAINADVNGSLNILRRYTKDTGIPKLIQSARDKGYVNSPAKLRVASY